MVKFYKIYTRGGAKLGVRNPGSHFIVSVAEGDIREGIAAVEALPGERVIQGFGLGAEYIPEPDARRLEA
jgi:hypothetical protein